MLFKDRQQAGKLLAARLEKYKNDPHVVVIGLPRGGVILAAEVARALHAPLDIICARKIGAPYNPEFGIGAITETGESYLAEDIIEQLDIPPEYIQEEIKTQSKEAARRLEAYKKGRPPLNFKDKIVIIVDDGIATGATMKASILAAKARKAKKVLVAVPVAPPDTIEDIKELADEVVCLITPPFFQAVGQFYENFSQTTDEEVIALLMEDN